MSTKPSLRASWQRLRLSFAPFAPHIRAERGTILTTFAWVFAGVVMKLVEPWPLKLVLDHLIVIDRPSGEPIQPVFGLSPLLFLSLCALLVMAATGLRALCEYAETLGFTKVGNRVLGHVRERVFLHLQALSISFHTQARTGDLVLRVTRDVNMLRDVAATALLPLLANLLVLLGMVSIMFWLEWRLALLVLATTPLYAVLTIRLSTRIQEVARKQRKREGDLAATAAESMAAIKVVQAMSLEKIFAEDFTNRSQQSQKQDVKAARLSAQLERSTDLLVGLATALVLWFGTWMIFHNQLSAGDLVVFLAYLKRAYSPAKDFAKYTGRLAKAAAAGERVVTLLDTEPEVRDRPGALPAPHFRGDIRFEHVGFAYGDGRVVFDDLDLHIGAGQFVAIVGASGIGKSTLAGLVLRLHDPTSGLVRMDGLDLRDFTLVSVRGQISVVLQDTLLFAGSVRDNIAMGAGLVSDGVVEAAARLAQAHDFICALPDGYDTLVGERGADLSQGQRQRIALARAAVRDVPILVLDEPTTGLDPDNRVAVADAIARLARGRTTILITHDTDLARQAQLLVRIEGHRAVPTQV